MISLVGLGGYIFPGGSVWDQINKLDKNHWLWRTSSYVEREKREPIDYKTQLKAIKDPQQSRSLQAKLN